MMAKPMKTLELHYPLIQFLIISGIFYQHALLGFVRCGLLVLFTFISTAVWFSSAQIQRFESNTFSKISSLNSYENYAIS